MSSLQKSRAAETWHRYHVYHDPEFIKDIKALPKRKLSNIPGEYDSYDDYRRLGEKYGIRPDFVDFVHERDWTDFEPNKNIGINIVHQNPKYPGFIASLDIDVTKEQMLDVYKEIQRLRQEIKIPNKKYKKPEDTKLLYAVFKARKNNMTFRAIFSDYQQGQLPLYKNMPTNKFSSEDELEKYYRTHYIDRV